MELRNKILHYERLYKNGEISLNSNEFKKLEKEVIASNDGDLCEKFLLCFGENLKNTKECRKIFCEQIYDPERHVTLVEKIGGTAEDYFMHQNSIKKYINQDDIWIKYFNEHIKENGIVIPKRLTKNNNGRV